MPGGAPTNLTSSPRADDATKITRVRVASSHVQSVLFEILISDMKL